MSKTKITTLFSILFILLKFNSLAQVDIGKTTHSLVGKNTLLAENISEALLDNFAVAFWTYSYGADQGGNNAKGTYNSAGAAAYLTNFDEQLAQEITDEAYAYFVQKWKDRGINVKVPTVAEIEASKKYAKDKSKGKAQIVNGGMIMKEEKTYAVMSARPSNVNLVESEVPFQGRITGNASFFPTDLSGNVAYVSFRFNVNFIEFKAGIGTQAFIKGEPGLKAQSGTGFSLWVKSKFVAAGYSNDNADGGADFFDSVDKSSSSAVLGTSTSATWKYLVNKEKYKAACVEIIKKSLDSQFAKYDEDVAKEKK